MSSPIRTERHGPVLVIVSDHPPVNALAAPVRQGLEAAVRQGAADASVAAMVIRCAGRSFFAGADITELGKPMADPDLPALVAIVEASEKPVVAAIHGTALGGGCELALACHYRIAARSARLGMPEVKLGLIPGAGGTQRLPRLVGIAQSLPMVAIGDPVPAPRALEIGLVDRLAEDAALVADAIAFAREIARNRPVPRTSQRPVAPDPEAIAAFRIANARRFRGFDAPDAAVDAVAAAADRPFADGLAAERAAFVRLLTGPQSAAQRHVFFAERRAARIDGLDPAVAPRPVRAIGIVGAGTMGGGIALAFLMAGLPVTIVEPRQPALEAGTALIHRTIEVWAQKGRLSPAAAQAAAARLTPARSLDGVAACDLVIEAAYEDMAVKLDIFRQLDAIVKPGAVLATNTSYLDVAALAAATTRPQDVIGLHFFSPAHVMKLVEVVRTPRTAPEVLATAMAVAGMIRKVPVLSRPTPGFIGNRMLRQRQGEAMRLLMEGATPEQVDRVHRDFGMPMGPFEMADLAGIDIGWHRDPARIENIRDALAAEGRFGQKAGAGFYDYDAARTPLPSPRVTEIVEAFRHKAGAPAPRVIDAREIMERTLYPLVNEGARILEDGTAQRASDIDVVWIYGYGWPAWRGGPMFWANAHGLKTIVAGLERHGFAVAPRLAAAADPGAGAEGQTLH